MDITAGRLESGGAAGSNGSSAGAASHVGSARGVAARRLHDDIDDSLGHASPQRQRTLGGMLERVAKHGGVRVWRGLKRHPFATVAAIGAASVVVASVVGVGELVVAGVVAMGAYEVLRAGEPAL